MDEMKGEIKTSENVNKPKKKLVYIFLVIILIMVIVTVGVLISKPRLNNDDGETPLNTKVELSVILDEVAKIEEFKDGVDAVSTINFGEFNSLEKMALVTRKNQIPYEVWLIKLNDLDQQESLCRILGNKIQDMKRDAVGGSKEIEVLNNAVIKQEDGIVIMIISDNVTEVEAVIGNAM